jgi:hypothetical protein
VNFTAIRNAVGSIALAAAFAAEAQNLPPELDIGANDIAFNEQTGMLYASIPSSVGLAYGNRLIEISPADASITGSVFVGSEPHTIGMSPDAPVAYVGLDGAASVRPVDLTSLTAGTQFWLGGDVIGTYYPIRIAVMPGAPGTVAVARSGCCSSNGVAIFDSGVMRANAQPYPYNDSSSIGFGSDPNTLYGYDNTDSGFSLVRMTIDATGIAPSLAVADGVIHGFNTWIVTDGDTVFSTSGAAVDGLKLQLLGTYTTGTFYNYSDAIVVDRATSSVILVQGNILYVFDRETYLKVNTLTIAAATGNALHAAGCGPACVAVLYDSNQIFVVQDVRDIFGNGFE